MATVDATTTTTTTTTTETMESGKEQDTTTTATTAAAPPPPPPPPPPRRRRSALSGCANLALRVLLLAVTVAGLVLLVIGKQTLHFRVAQFPGLVFSRSAEFNDSPALIYLLVALCATCLYSLLTALASLRLIFVSSPTKTLFLLVLLDALYAAIMASATGSAGGVGWIALKGNTHTNWSEICNMYGKFCRYIGSSIFLGLAASIILVLLTILSAHSLYRCSR